MLTDKMNLNGNERFQIRKPPATPNFVIDSGLQIEKTWQKLNEVIGCAREELSRVKSRKAKTLLETTIALVEGLMKAYEHYENCWKQKYKQRFFRFKD